VSPEVASPGALIWPLVCQPGLHQHPSASEQVAEQQLLSRKGSPRHARRLPSLQTHRTAALGRCQEAPLSREASQMLGRAWSTRPWARQIGTGPRRLRSRQKRRHRIARAPCGATAGSGAAAQRAWAAAAWQGRIHAGGRAPACPRRRRKRRRRGGKGGCHLWSGQAGRRIG
jgi:hypothetical protein